MIEHENAFYDTYSFYFDLPFGLKKKRSLFHGLIAGEPWAWRVIGITEKALIELEKHDFEYTPGLICRAHFVEREETSKEIFSKKIPREKFFEHYFKTDVTAIALRSENRPGSPPPSEYIPIDPELKLFTSTMFGFRHGRAERQHLRDLHTAYKSGKVKLTTRPG